MSAAWHAQVQVQPLRPAAEGGGEPMEVEAGGPGGAAALVEAVRQAVEGAGGAAEAQQRLRALQARAAVLVD